MPRQYDPVEPGLAEQPVNASKLDGPHAPGNVVIRVNEQGPVSASDGDARAVVDRSQERAPTPDDAAIGEVAMCVNALQRSVEVQGTRIRSYGGGVALGFIHRDALLQF